MWFEFLWIRRYVPFSSTNPVSCRDFWQVAWEQVKWDKHQDRPRAVINGPLKLGKNSNESKEHLKKYKKKSIFYLKNDLNLCKRFSHWRLIKWWPTFDDSTLFHKIQKFLWSMMIFCQKYTYVIFSDEPELEFFGSSRAKLGRFRAKPIWGTLIFELKPSWTENFLTHLFTKFLSSEVLHHDFMII